MTVDPRDYDLRRLRIEAAALTTADCPNGPDRETGEWPCDPRGYFGVYECQVCGRVGIVRDERGHTLEERMRDPMEVTE